jgi:hypothetical protein
MNRIYPAPSQLAQVGTMRVSRRKRAVPDPVHGAPVQRVPSPSPCPLPRRGEGPTSEPAGGPTAPLFRWFCYPMKCPIGPAGGQLGLLLSGLQGRAPDWFPILCTPPQLAHGKTIAVRCGEPHGKMLSMGLASPPPLAKPAEPPLHKKEEPPQARIALMMIKRPYRASF